MKRILIGLILGSVLALNLASLAAARISDLGLLDSEPYPDTPSSLTVIDTGSRQSARLRAIDAEFYPDSFGAENVWQMPAVEYQVAAADWYFDCD